MTACAAPPSLTVASRFVDGTYRTSVVGQGVIADGPEATARGVDRCAPHRWAGGRPASLPKVLLLTIL